MRDIISVISMARLKNPNTSDWINFLMHKRKSLDEITNNIWRSYYSERTISLTVIAILITTILTLASLYTQIIPKSTEGTFDLIPILSAFLSGIAVYLISRYLYYRKITMDAILKLAPFRTPLDRMLIKLINGEYKSTTELKEEYEETMTDFQKVIADMSKKIPKQDVT